MLKTSATLKVEHQHDNMDFTNQSITLFRSAAHNE